MTSPNTIKTRNKRRNQVRRALEATPNCPQCQVRMVHNVGGIQHSRSDVTRDHILPRSRGGGNRIHGDVRNTRIMCQECNELTAKCHQCVAALACAATVARDTERTARVVLKDWRMGYVVDAMHSAGAP